MDEDDLDRQVTDVANLHGAWTETKPEWGSGQKLQAPRRGSVAAFAAGLTRRLLGTDTEKKQTPERAVSPQRAECPSANRRW